MGQHASTDVQEMFAVAMRLHQAGRLNEAEDLYRRALALKPDYAEAHGNLGNVLQAQGRVQEALESYSRALTYKPSYAEAHNNLGIVLAEQGKLDEAVASYGRALSHKPDYVEAHSHLGDALKEQGKFDEAMACYGRALALDPGYGHARMGRAIATIPIFANSVAESTETIERFARSLDELTAWSSADRGKLGQSVGSNQPFYLAYRPGDVTPLLSRYGDVVCAAAADHWRKEVEHSRTGRAPRDRIRVVVVNGQVRQQHPVWEVILRGIAAHIDRRQFEIFFYHTGSIVDEETVWARTHVDRFVQGPKPMKAWLREVMQDRPDVMFYPEVGLDPSTCTLATLRLAPLQVASWGHPVTTGLPSMDLFLSGDLLEGPEAQQHYREKLVRLPGTGVCTERAGVHSQRWEGPGRYGNIVRFALCQQPIKFDPADDILLTRIAQAVGPSEFWLASARKLHWTMARLRDRLAAVFRAQGLDPDAHLRVMPWLPRNQFVGFLQEMDVYLDCPAFSGYTTAWQAIHSSLPIVTLEGQFLRQRLAAGLLRQIGMTDGIAQSREQYVEIAVRLGEECRLADQRAARREATCRAAPQSDGNRSAVRAFEQALIDALDGPGRGARGLIPPSESPAS